MPTAVSEQTKQRARWLVQKRLQRGTMTRPDRCERCGEPWCVCGTPEGHHPDYSKPAEVVFLCRDCHRQEHEDEYWTDPVPE